MDKLKKYQAALLTCAVLTLLVFCVHLKKPDSLLCEKCIDEMVDFHQVHPAFVRRPLTTYATQGLSVGLQLSLAKSFVLFNFTLLFLNGLLLYRLSGCFTSIKKNRLVAVGSYYLCAPVLFSFYQPVYSYDEPIQYFFIFLALNAFYRENFTRFILFFSGALIARENSLILLPALWFLLSVKSKKSVYFNFILLIPVAIYVPAITTLIHYHNIAAESLSDTVNRFDYLFFNFSDRDHSLEVLFSFIICLGLPTVLWFVNRKKMAEVVTTGKKFNEAFLICLILNSAIVILTTQAREFRLFMLPLVFLWPLSAGLLPQKVWNLFSLNNISLFLSKPLQVFSVVVSLIVSYLVAFKIYRTTIGNLGDNYFNLYLFAILSFISTYFFSRAFPGK